LALALVSLGAVAEGNGETPSAGQAKAHWAFVPPQRPPVPPVKNTRWPRNPIDQFVLARLEAEGLAPSPEADRATLIRRVSLDLVGLPPSPAEVEGFLHDPRPDAYERLVDRLLASPHFGEHWALHWLDLARYADSDGYEKDLARPYAWLYRDWVIDALNRDLPFDQFTLEQLAGDLLPNATDSQKIATGFHRNTLTNREGGIDPEEDRVKQTFDRVNTTSAVWLGLTVGCAQCHDHKYDPISQREYYQLYAFFNSLREVDLPAPQPAELARYRRDKAAFDAEHARLLQARDDDLTHEFPQRSAAWEHTAKPPTARWSPLRPRAARSANGATMEIQPDDSIVASGNNPATDTYTVEVATDLARLTAFRLEVLPDPKHPLGPGRSPHGNFVLSEFSVSAPTEAQDTRPLAFAGAAASFAADDHPIAAAIDGDPKTGWAVFPRYNHRHAAVFRLAQPVSLPPASRLIFKLEQTHGNQHTLGKVRLSATGDDGIVEPDVIPSDVAAWLAVPPDARPEEARSKLREFYRSLDERLLTLEWMIASHAANEPAFPDTQAQTLAELTEPRPTHLLVRGDFLRLGEAVSPGVPAALPPLPTPGGQASRRPSSPAASEPSAHSDFALPPSDPDRPVSGFFGASGDSTGSEPSFANDDRRPTERPVQTAVPLVPTRLDLARWLVDPAHPLTARVHVNRLWQHLFGHGLVRTPEDFGSRGERPTHPELLDWLATEFPRRGWSQKAIIRLIVTSATYRQASRHRPELAARDPENRLLARQNRWRLAGETIRDAALSVSGRLATAVGGPSIRPPLPADIPALGYANSIRWPYSEGAERYRRGLYIFKQRTVPYPMLAVFDAPDWSVTCTRRERSNTPLQALTLLNDPVFFECAQALGHRLASAPTQSVRERLRFGFRLCLARVPTAEESARLERLYADQHRLLASNPASAHALAGAPGLPPERVVETAAFIAVARTLLNLEEFVTRP
jgi:hypothetical protein